MGAKGAIDFAGGTVVHISSGISALVVALYLGARRGYPRTAMHPNNLVMTLVGAGLLWVGWFGFNAGSSINSNLDTARALTVTQVAAASGALMWMLIEAMKHNKVTSLGLASGILAGLVAITPAAGVVQVKGAMLLGCIASICSYAAIQLKSKLGYDDTLDVFGIHGVSGIAGALGLTFFIRPSWMADAAAAAGGTWTVMQQFGVQIAAVLITVIYAAVISLVLAVFVQKVFGFRVSQKEEMEGLDHSLHGEHGYGLINLN
jgi:Amt family ammonium transporter